MLVFTDGGQDLIDVGVVSFSETLGQLYFADIEFCAESAVLAPLPFKCVPALIDFRGIPALIDRLYRLAASAGGSLCPEFVN